MLDFFQADTAEFDPQTYIRILIAIAKADKDNGPPEFAFVKRQAQRLKLDYQYFLDTTDPSFSIQRHQVSRLTAMVILKDAMLLASLDRNFSLPEKQRVYQYAEKLDIPRSDIDALEKWLGEYRRLADNWRQLVSGHAV